MATSLQNLSSYDSSIIPSGKGKKVAIVVSDWNSAITNNLLEGAYKTLLNFEVDEKDITIEHVPGSFELTYATRRLLESSIGFDCVIILGCVIQGDTPHFTFVCDSVTQGITDLNLRYNAPIVFGLLTTNTLDQAKARSGGRHGNKGDEAATTALRMIELDSRYKK